MITLGFFFVMLISNIKVTLGPFADFTSCATMAQAMNEQGIEVISTCYETILPSPDSTVELERDSQG